MKKLLLALLLIATPAFADGLIITPSVVGTSQIGQIQGTNTNDDAAVGYVGEYVSDQTSSSVALTTGVAINVASISLTPGDWDVSGVIGFGPASTTTIRTGNASLSTVSNTTSGADGYWDQPVVASSSGTSSGGINFASSVGPARFSLSTTTTIYLVANAIFSTSTMNASGIVRARRVR